MAEESPHHLVLQMSALDISAFHRHTADTLHGPQLQGIREAGATAGPIRGLTLLHHCHGTGAVTRENPGEESKTLT